MRFMGGKNRISKDLASILTSTSKEIMVEPFCGALHVTAAVLKTRPEMRCFCSDVHEDLIDMWVALQNGSFTPPTGISKDEYYRLKDSASSPLRTFVGYGCSFSGKWWGSYASDSSGRNYCRNACNSVIKTQKCLKNITFTSSSYEKITIPSDAFVYCDPPYAGTSKPGTGSKFDHRLFWEWVEELAVSCFVSEYVAPDFMQEVWRKSVKTDMWTKNGQENRIEKLFWNGKE